jgi:hypothetical protein
MECFLSNLQLNVTTSSSLWPAGCSGEWGNGALLVIPARFDRELLSPSRCFFWNFFVPFHPLFLLLPVGRLKFGHINRLQWLHLLSSLTCRLLRRVGKRIPSSYSGEIRCGATILFKGSFLSGLYHFLTLMCYFFICSYGDLPVKTAAHVTTFCFCYLNPQGCFRWVGGICSTLFCSRRDSLRRYSCRQRNFSVRFVPF